MNANELRIGNYVNVPREDQSPFKIDFFETLSDKFIKVAMIHPEFGENFHPLTWYGDDLSPIPLSEEWLVKLGFEKQKGIYRSFYQSNDNNYLSICFDDDRYYFMDVNEDPSFSGFNYVHQLQNLYFALTGTELAYENETK